MYKFLNTIPLIKTKGIYEGANYEFDKFAFSHLVARAEVFGHGRYKKVIYALYSKVHKLLMENRDRAQNEEITNKILTELNNVEDFFVEFVNETKNVQIVETDDE